MRRSPDLSLARASILVVALTVAAVALATVTSSRAAEVDPRFNVVLPGDFPRDLTPPGDAVLIHGSTLGDTVSGSWTTDLPSQDAAEAYRDHLDGGGRWNLESFESLGTSHSLSFFDTQGTLGYGVITIDEVQDRDVRTTTVGVSVGVPPPVPYGPSAALEPTEVALPAGFPTHLAPLPPGARVTEAAMSDDPDLPAGALIAAVPVTGSGGSQDIDAIDGVVRFYREVGRAAGDLEEVATTLGHAMTYTAEGEQVSIAITPSLYYAGYVEVTILVEAR